MICAYLATPHAHGKDAPPPGWFDRVSEGAFEGMLRMYKWALDIVLRWQFATLMVTLATVVLTVYLYITAPKGFFPQQDTGRIQATSEAPADISFQEMSRRQRDLAEVLLRNPDITTFSSSIGPSGFNPLVNQGRFWIDLKPVRERKPMDDVMADIRHEAAKVQGINLFLQPVQDLKVGGRSSKSPYQYTLSDVDVIELNTFAPRLLDKLKAMPELTGVTTDQTQGGLGVRVVVDRDAAARMGLTPSDVDSALYDAFGQRQVAIMYSALDQFRVILEVDPALQRDPSALEWVFVKSPKTGTQVPLRSIAHFEDGTQPLSITHQGQFPSVTLSFGLAPNISLGQATKLIEDATHSLQPPPGLRASFQGNAQAFQDSLSSESWLIATSIVAIYIILGVLYESLIHPLTILSTIPPAGIGALLALMLFGYPLDFMGLIGIILLIGIVKKNAIMMIDFAIEAERDHAMNPAVAIREACLLRFRPIMMTTMAALLGALPMALGRGSGSELRHPLGIAIVGGLIFSQALTLFTTPVVYIFLDRLRPAQKDKPAHAETAPQTA
jgi:multidrug efflux pump subunit AcrB